LNPYIHSTKIKGTICDVPLHENYGLVIITLALLLSDKLVMIQNIYLYPVVSTIRNDAGEANNNIGMKKA